MEKMENRKWRVVRSEYLARKPWFTVRHECVELPNGQQLPDYYVFEYPEWVNVIAITSDDKFVFISQYRHGLEDTFYELPAGVSEPSDASMEAAAQRELLEETGYGGGRWHKLMSICANPATQNNLTHCFLATGVEPICAQQLDDTEEICVHLLSRDEVKELLRTDAIRQALMAAPLWRYFADSPE